MNRSALLKSNIDQTYPIVVVGRGVFLYDDQGREYLDGSSGAMTANIGHGVEAVADAMRDQAAAVAFTYRTQFTNAPAEELATRLTELAPGDIDYAFFVNSGSEASEMAIRAAVGYWNERGRPSKAKVLGRAISYHGMTMGALSLSGHDARRGDYGPLLHPFAVAPPAYAYRFAYPGESESDYAARAAAEFEEAILAEGVGSVAAIIVEPIVGAAGGVLVPPRGYMQRLREICDRLDVLLIVDEVITGLGRTGAWFASADEGIVPDIILTGKGTSAGYTPIASVLLRSRVVEAFRDGSGIAPFGHTFSGNPLSAATCLAVLDYIEQNDLLANAQARGAQLEAGLRAIADEYSCVADVRGRGLMWGFEFVMDKESATPPPASRQTAALFVEECFARQLVVYPAGIAPLNNATLLAPPLVISEDEIDLMLSRLRSAVRAMSRHIERWAGEDTIDARSASSQATGLLI